MYMECISSISVLYTFGYNVCFFYIKIEIKCDGGIYFIKITSCSPNLAENTISLFYNYPRTPELRHHKHMDVSHSVDLFFSITNKFNPLDKY